MARGRRRPEPAGLSSSPSVRQAGRAGGSTGRRPPAGALLRAGAGG